MTYFPFFLLFSFSKVLHLFYICFTFVLLVSLFVCLVLLPLSDSLLFTNLIISLLPSKNSMYLYSCVIPLLSGPRTSTWLCLLYLFLLYHHVISHKGNWLGTFFDQFWMDKEKFTRVGFEPVDWCAGALPTELTSPILAVSLFCQYLCSEGTSQKSFNHILLFSQGSRLCSFHTRLTSAHLCVYVCIYVCLYSIYFAFEKEPARLET